MNDTHAGWFGPPAGEADIDRLSGIVAYAFGFPPAEMRGWLDRAGLAQVRVARSGDGEVAAGLLRIPMGQFFGGRSVPLVGIAGVGVAPEARGTGLATRLMQETMTELRAEGFALAGLYASTQPLYRRAGFEQAGTRVEYRAVPRLLAMADRTLPVIALGEADRPEAQRLYREMAVTRDGWLDRGPYIWGRVWGPRAGTAHAFGVVEDGAMSGYVVLVQSQNSQNHLELRAMDLVARTPGTARRLLTLLADHGSVADHVTWCGGPDDPLAGLLPEPASAVTIRQHWMLRVLDVQRALQARGWPAGLRASLTLELHGDILDGLDGRYALEVAGGEAAVRPGASSGPLLRVTMLGLPGLYTGFRSPAVLKAMGLCDGTPDAMAAAQALFAGPPPSTPDMY